MPTKKLRGTESRNMSTPSLAQAMGIPTSQRIGTPTDPHDYLFRNIKENNTKGTAKSPNSWNAGYDVNTRVSIGNAKTAGSAKRTMRKMKPS